MTLPDWLERASDWFTEKVAEHGYSITGEVEQFKAWHISTILRLEAEKRSEKGVEKMTFYFKATPDLPLFVNEAKVTKALSSLFPRLIPVPVAINEEERWMILEDFGDLLLEKAEISVWEETLGTYARLQEDTQTKIDLLLAAGCLDRRLEILPSRIEPLIEDVARFKILDKEEIAFLKKQRPTLEEKYLELNSYKIPQTLVHGDLHARNIVLQNGKPLFFDWSDACIAHPFFDLVTFKEEDIFKKDRFLFEKVKETYLEVWRKYEPPENVERALELGLIIGTLHHVISYQHIFTSSAPGMEWQSANDWKRFLKRLIGLLM